MDLLRLSSNHVEFMYNKYENMQSTITLYNDTLTPIAYKFKASNRNIFLVRPSLGIVQPKQNQIINISLHCKVLQNISINEFNEKLQLISIPIFSGIQDPTPIFQDTYRSFDNQKISIIIQTIDRKITSQIGLSDNHIFQSLHKQNSELELQNNNTEQQQYQTRFQTNQCQTNSQLLQQEIAQKEQQLLNFQKTHNISNDKQSNQQIKNSKDTILVIMVSILSFYIFLRYFDLINRIIPK
ncbi:unnamed protein product [Paramecium primaurelia]|uniref:MSP domain-containing protein n=1 Tax=Paramecium primaurelia TaxID=5886 RepID=A0A8S1Q9W2_PARPR|nr:unnamed protein product [Paramecium primaurelia]